MRNDKPIIINTIELNKLFDKIVRIKAIKEIINPNKNILGKIVLKNLLLPLLFNDAKTDGETTAEKNIIDPIKNDNKIFVIKIIKRNYSDIRWSMLNFFGPLIAKIKNPPAKATFFKKLVNVIGSAKSLRKIKAVAKQNNPSAIEDNLT